MTICSECGRVLITSDHRDRRLPTHFIDLEVEVKFNKPLCRECAIDKLREVTSDHDLMKMNYTTPVSGLGHEVMALANA